MNQQQPDHHPQQSTPNENPFLISATFKNSRNKSTTPANQSRKRRN